MKLFTTASALTGFLTEGSANNFKNLTVSYGFNKFPSEYTCDGVNVSQRIEISGLSGISNVKSTVIILDDPDALEAHLLIG